MDTQRTKKAKLNISVSLLKQLITLVCGLIVPRAMLRAFGSEANGAVASIAQFLAYITLLEGGIGGVARAALYKPIASWDKPLIGSIMYEVQRFFRVVGGIFAVYVLVLACSFSAISRIECFDWLNTAILVIVISLSTFGQYFIGLSYSILIQATQRNYVTDALAGLSTVLNTVVTLVLIGLGSNLIVVKLASSIVFLLRPYVMMLYVRRKFGIVIKGEKGSNYLNQKWTGLGQHIAYFLHSNTDISVLTIFRDLKLVSVYSVYNMIVAQIQNVTTAFSSGLEALFGNMLANHEIEALNRTFDFYETMISMVSTTLFGTTLGMIMPFVRLYTVSITDVNYIEPLFAVLLIAASILFCWKLPYQAAVHAAGHYRQTKLGAYGEALINIVVSVILVIRLGLVGVAIGTIAATLFRLVYYVVYLTNNNMMRSVALFVKRQTVNILTLILLYLLGTGLNARMEIGNLLHWVMLAATFAVISTLITALVNLAVYREQTLRVISKLMPGIRTGQK